MWQMLLKGIAEAQAATRPAAAAEMVLVRIAYVADMPTPDEAIRMIEQTGGASSVGARARRRATRRRRRPLLPPRPPPLRRRRKRMSATGAQRGTARPQAMASAQEVQSEACARAPQLSGTGRIGLREARSHHQRPRWRPMSGWCGSRTDASRSRWSPMPSAPWSNDLSRKLELWTGRRWTVIVANAAGQPTLREQNLVAKGQREAAAEADPRVKEVLARFPGAQGHRGAPACPEPLESDISAIDPDADLDADDLGRVPTATIYRQF